MDNFINNNIDNSINNDLESINLSMDNIENELNNINISYVNEDNNIVEPSTTSDEVNVITPDFDVIEPQPEENKNLFDVEPIVENKIEEPSISNIELPVVDDISIPEYSSPASENESIDNNYFTFDDNGIVTAPVEIETVTPIEEKVDAAETPAIEEANVESIDEKLKSIIESVNNININYAKIKSVIENAKLTGIADSDYLKATFEKMAIYDVIIDKFNEKADKYISSRLKGETEEKDTNLDNMVFMEDKMEKAA